jgi:nucleoside-diphosphate-sugar epimerase
MRILVVGGSGRVGSSVIQCLRAEGIDVMVLERHDLVSLVSDSSSQSTTKQIHQGLTAVVNLAGKAHLKNDEQLQPEIWTSNVGLPLELAKISRKLSIPLLHLSSTKAVINRKQVTLYAASKWCGEILLREYAEKTGTRIVCLRTCAVLAPPYEAGKLSLLKKFAWLPNGLVPTIRMPVIHPRDLTLEILEAVSSSGRVKQPFEIRTVKARTNLRLVLRGLRRQHQERTGRF